MPDEKNNKVDHSFQLKDLEHLSELFTMARGYAAMNHLQDRNLMSDLLNYEAVLVEKIMRTFTPEQLAELKEKAKTEANKNQELEEFKQTDEEQVTE